MTSWGEDTVNDDKGEGASVKRELGSVHPEKGVATAESCVGSFGAVTD